MLMRVCSAGSGSNLFVQLLQASMDASDSDSDSSDSDLDDIPNPQPDSAPLQGR